MSEQETTNKAAARRFFEEVWNKGNLGVIDELIAPSHVQHDPNNPNTAPGPAGVRQLVSLYRNAFPDAHFTIDDIFADGDKVVTRVTATGTQQRDLPGVPATGKHVSAVGIVIDRYENGKNVESWTVFDFLGMYQQLGVIPSLAGAPTAATMR